MRKQIAIIIISSIFMLALMTSSPVSSVRVAGNVAQNEQNLPYSVSVSPPVLRVQQKDLATFDVKVSRGPSDTEPSSVHLSLVSDSSLLKSTGSFNPPVLNFRQGQTFANSTLRVDSQEIGVGTTAFGVQAATQSQSPATSDRALSNPATIVVRAAEPESQSLTTSESLPTGRTAESIPSESNYPPIAKAGQDQIIKEGERGILDASASTDRDKDALSFSWQQISPKQPIIKLYPSDASSKVSFLAPDVSRDTTFRFKLLVKDTDGAQAVDSINVLTKNVEESEPESGSPPPAAGLPKPEEERGQTQNQEKPSSPESPSNAASPPTNQVPASTENHSPTAEAQQALLTGEGKPLSITLNGNDADKDDKISYVILSNPTHGTTAGFDKTTGALTYIPTSGFVGQDRLTYKVVDSHGAESNAGVVVIRVTTASQPSSQLSAPSPSNPSSSLAPPEGNATTASFGALALDETPPEVVSTDPGNGATLVPINKVITATFSEPMDATTVNTDTFKVFFFEPIDSVNIPVEGTVTLSSTDQITATFTPDANLNPNSDYFVQINGDSSPAVKDLAGNSMISNFESSFTTGTQTTAEITLTLDPALPKWGHSFDANVHVTGQGEDDTISIDFGDGTVLTGIPISSGGDATASHVYSKEAASTPAKTVVAKLLTPDPDGQIERATTQVATTIQKHATSLTLDMRPSPEVTICTDCHFTTFGKLVDLEPAEPEPVPDVSLAAASSTSATSNPQEGLAAASSTSETSLPEEIGGKTITFSGSGSSPLHSVPTEGLTFSGGSNPLTLTSTALRMHVGSSVDLSYSGVSASGITLDFEGASGSSVGVTLTKAVAPFDTVSTTFSVAGGSQNVNFAKGFSKLTITSVGGSSSPSQYADLATIITRNILVSPQEQFEIHFNNVVPVPGQYPVLVINPGSYFAAGITQHNSANGLKVKAQFDGTSDPLYATATSSEISYSLDSAGAGSGDADTTPDDVVGPWTTLTVGTAINGDVCTFNGQQGADADRDGLCDRWESPTTPSPGTGLPANSPTARYVICPSNTNFATIDPQCPTGGQPSPVMYNLCSAGCPTLGKKDIYVEIDSKSGFVPSDTAINNVIKAFANAPVAPNGPGPIALHVIKDDTISTIPNNLFVWRDPAPTFNNGIATDDFFNVKKTNFGTVKERTGCATTCPASSSGIFIRPSAPGFTPPTASQAWSTPGKTLKHYGYHFGLSVNFYSKTSGLACPSGGLSSGVGEVLGNDFVISLGCGWGAFDTSPRSLAQQAGTFMHELGHNLALHHGGPATAKIGRTTADFKMNCKPNYFSVMNYARQMPWDLAGTVGTIDSTDIANWEGERLASGDLNYRVDATKFSTMLDYSGTTAPQQNEGGLNEAAGSAAADGKKYHVVYLKTNAGTATVGTDNPNFDFTGNNVIASVGGDINAVGSPVAGCGPLSPEIENSYNDWNEINLVFLPDGDSVDGVTKQISDPYTGTIEVAPSYSRAIAAKAHALDIQFIPPPPTDGNFVFNVGQTVPLKFRLLDQNNAPIKNAAVMLVVQKIPNSGTSPTIPPTPVRFVYDPAKDIYQYDLKTDSKFRGPLALSYYLNFGTPNRVLLQGPEAQASGSPYTLKITGR